jgi:NAD(P)-dependent dehydrogenase (short-subunit alcohol dehydrogenase family)
MPPLHGTRVLVTGGTSGLGRAMTVALVEAGARVILTGRERARAQAVAGDIGPSAIGVELDVRDEASVQAAVDESYELLGGIDVLVNTAGIGTRTVNPAFLTDPQPFWRVAPGGFRDLLETKVTGTFLLTRAVVPRMLTAARGRIVVISMSEQTMTRQGFVPYGPAGAAVEALARVMAADLRETAVSLNILLPGGATATGMIPDEVPAERRAALLDPMIMGPAIVWLASDEANGVHNERIVAAEFESWLARR